MEFPSQTAAKEFLVQKILEQARRENVVLTDEDRRLLYYSVDDPASGKEIREERLVSDESEYEERVARLLRNAYEVENKSGQRQLFQDALNEINKGDHYLAVMATEALRAKLTHQLPWGESRATLRDNILYLLIAFGLVAAIVAYLMLTEH